MNLNKNMSMLKEINRSFRIFLLLRLSTKFIPGYAYTKNEPSYSFRIFLIQGNFRSNPIENYHINHQFL